ncbi:Replicon protein A2, putative isoform 2 [Hibiscus syriacus]|uniref:Replicon protein A2, putative isoform 2 n=1 Tax=Hibiscus syriacus TaxID=106335 RepID=A0A6A3CTX6_HIBSY|nr:Replicon protein A2, putative isoform 2 [Hibiscus syriacus]
MFSSSQFDGFTPSQFANSTPFLARLSRDTLGLVPETVKMISEASQSGDGKSNFIIDGVDVPTLRWIGMAYNKISRDGTYVRVNGHLQSCQGKKQLSAFSMRDAMEFLEREGKVYSSIDDYHYKAVEGLKL